MEESLNMSENYTRRTKTDPKWFYSFLTYLAFFVGLLVFCFCFTSDPPDCDEIESCKNSFEKQMLRGLQNSFKNVIYLSIFALGLSAAVLVLLYKSSLIFFWFTVGMTLIISTGPAITLWSTYRSESATAHTVIAVIVTIVSIIFLIVLFFTLQRRVLIIQMMKEARYSITATPTLLLPPLLTCVTVIVLKIIFILVVFICINVGNWKDPVKVVTQILGIFAFIWLMQFIMAIQSMVVAYSVAQWYYAVDQSNLKTSVRVASSIVFKYHLGSAFLHVFLTIFLLFINIFRVITQKIERLAEINSIFKGISTNAIHEVGIRGTDYVTSGRAVNKLLAPERFKKINVTGLSGFVLLIGRLSVLVTTIIAGFFVVQSKDGEVQVYTPLVLVMIFALFFIDAFISAYKVALDTIYMCMCDDLTEVDGVVKSFHMSKELYELCIENNAVNAQ